MKVVMETEDGWTKVVSRTRKYHTVGTTVPHVPTEHPRVFSNQAEPHNREYTPYHNQVKFRSKPVEKYWCGFEEDGTERWYIRLENGNVLSSKDHSYNFLSKKFFSDDQKT